jgi:predicted DsbA family dithiol-disulfide isomerase
MTAAALPVVFPIDFIGDVVCPWCFLGWTRLKAALAQRPDLAPIIAWRPFQLQFDIPDEGVPYQAFMDGLFSEPGRRRQMDRRLVDLGAAEGMTFRLDAIRRRPNSNAALRLIRWAGPHGGAVAEAVMRAYFTEGRDIGDPAVLVDIAAAAGLDADEVRVRLAAGQDRQTVDQECAMASQAGIGGVPFIILDNRVALAGAEEPARLVQAIDKALALRAQTP